MYNFVVHSNESACRKNGHLVLGKVNFNIQHFICCLVITSTQHSPHIVSEQLNEYIEEQALFEERSSIGFNQFHTQGLVIKLVQTGNCSRSTQSLEYQQNYNSKQILLLRIGLNFKPILRLVLEPCMKNGTSIVLFLFFLLEIDSNIEKTNNK